MISYLPAMSIYGHTGRQARYSHRVQWRSRTRTRRNITFMSCVEALDARGLTLRPSPRQDTSPFSEFGGDAEGGPPVLSSPSAISMPESDSTARPNSKVRVSVRTGCSYETRAPK